jgi:hypothetical protein
MIFSFQGKITLKNGRSYEVYFEKDQLINPTFIEEPIKNPIQTGKSSFFLPFSIFQ